MLHRQSFRQPSSASEPVSEHPENLMPLVEQLQADKIALEELVTELKQANQQLQIELQGQQTIAANQGKSASAIGVDPACQVHTLLDHAPILAWMVSLEGNFSFANPAFLQVFEQTAEAIIGRSVDYFFPEEFAQEYRRNNQQVIDTRTVLETTESAKLPDGTVHTYLVRKFPVFGDGEIVAVGGVATDITALKRTEAALQTSEATNRVLMAALPDCLIRMRQDGTELEVLNEGAIHCLFANDLNLELPAYRTPQERREILGTETLVTEVMPLPIAQERINLARIALNTGEPQRQEYRLLHGEQTYYEEARIIPLVNNEVLVVVRDITQQKRSELELKATKEQLELFIRATSEGFWDWDWVTGDLYLSPQWKAMLGYADDELENSVDAWRSVIFEEDYRAALQLIEDYNSGRVERFEVTQKFHHESGSTVYVLSRAIHLKDDQDRVVRMVGCHFDLTPIVEMQAALKTSQVQLSSVLDSSLDGIMAFRSVRDETGTVVDFEWLLSNPTACNLVERSANELIGKQLLEEMPGNKTDGLFDLYVQVVESSEPMRRQFHYHHDGIECWFESVAVKLEDGFAVTFRDITLLKQSEQALQQLNQQLADRVDELNQHNAEMQLLGEMSDFLQACLTVQEAYSAITSLIAPLFPSCAGGIFVINDSRDRVESAATWGTNLQSVLDFHPRDCWGLRRGQIHWITPGRQGLCCKHIEPTIESADAANATLCIPMTAQGETLGLLYLKAETPKALSESKQKFARTVAEQIAMALANLSLRETLQQQSIRDPLTGLFNRRYLEEALNQEILRAQRHQHTISVIMLDLDHFKQLNDTHGHDAGDQVLQAVGKLLKENVRGSDLACRYGGEEMLLVLPESSLKDAFNRAEAIRVAIAELRVRQNGKLLNSITASLGVASFPAQGQTLASVMQAADAALYRAKAAGRNQVISAP